MLTDDRGKMTQESDNLFQYLESLIDRDVDPLKHEESIWQRYGKTVSLMVLDSSGFSRVSEKHGIVHFLSRLMLMRRVVKPIIEQNRSIEFHFHADKDSQIKSSIPSLIGLVLGITNWGTKLAPLLSKRKGS